MNHTGAAWPIERSLRLSLVEAFLYSLMVGIGESYIPAFVLSVGMGEALAGILASLPLVSGAVLQLFTPQALQRVRSHKVWVVIAVAMQSLALVPLIYFAEKSNPSFWVLLIILTLYWGAGFSASPAWNYWMGYLVPDDISQRFFSRRAWIGQVGILIGLIAGGMALHFDVKAFSFTTVFAELFFLAFLCRLGSSIFLSRKIFREEWNFPEQKVVGIFDSWKVFWQSKVKRDFFLVLFPYMGAVYLSSPFVSPYLLGQLKLDYGSYMIAIAALMLGKMTTLGILSVSRTSRRGLQWLILGVSTVSPLPALWAVSSHFLFILGLQYVSGMAWAGIEVGLSLIFFRDLEPQEKVPVLTVYNLFNAISIIIGTLIGGFILKITGESPVVPPRFLDKLRG